MLKINRFEQLFMVWSFSHVSILNHDATTWLDQYISICFNPSKSRFIKPSRIAGLLQVLRSFQKQSTQDCVVLALKSKVEHDIEEEFQVVRITDFENINLWMREDNHGTRFDTGCMIIVTTHNRPCPH